ncbi:hypothetical protein JRQ81_004019 [Phrynocephalus forsythii]|uniref:Death domain-containing protein n=1 Tax=Phrynocephalus forsythii TaxID=171643 RepID=A0A9Q0XLB4_9SAUR|nr:hypothetical protein JRQ81_004019 [Phrynocephalus forsythii]
MLVQIQIALLLLATHAPNINTGGHGPEAAVLGYISEFLNSGECHELYLRLATPHKEAEQPPEEKDLVSPHQQQAISNMDQCKESLSYWLEMQRGQVDWDRLARALRQIGRPDVSRELKKRLTKNRSLEPKGNPETNQTEETPESAAPFREKAPSLRTRQGPIQKSGRTFLEDKNEGLAAAFLKLFPLSWHNPTLQQYILPATKLLLTSFLAGLVLWLISVYYIICWNFGQCLFGSGLRCGGVPAGQNMNLTVIWNRHYNEDRDDLDTTEEEEEEVSEKEP